MSLSASQASNKESRHARAKTRASIAPQIRNSLTKSGIAEPWIAGSSPAMSIEQKRKWPGATLRR
jgi:hypothetical protein